MGEKSGIGWTDATFNPWWGCWPVSPGCALCYAAREAERYGWTEGGGSGPDLWQKQGPRRVFGEAHWSGKNSPRRWATTLPAELGRRPRVFTASMADIGEDHPIAEQERPKLWALIEDTPQLDWLLLTKRVETARQWLPARWLEPGGWPAHAWFLFSAEDQQRFDERLPYILDIPAPVLGCSYEPSLGGIDFRAGLSIAWQCSFCRRYFPGPYQKTCPACSREYGWSGSHRFNPPRGQRGPGLNWIIAGGESSRPRDRARAPHPSWFRSARDQAVAAGVAFFFKQWGEFAPLNEGATGSFGDVWVCDNGNGQAVHRQKWEPGSQGAEPGRWGAGDVLMRPVGKQAAGEHLDGKLWHQFPGGAP